jgi:hypothetical protein
MPHRWALRFASHHGPVVEDGSGPAGARPHGILTLVNAGGEGEGAAG